MSTVWRTVLVAALSVLLSVSCQVSQPSRPPDLLLITVDTLRADHLGAYGSTRALTPAVDAFASKSVVFSRATTVSNNTLPAHLGMLSGRYPAQAGVPRNGHDLPAGLRLLSQDLRDRGYLTAAFVSASALSAKLGLSRGFDVYDQDFSVKELDQAQRRASTTVDAALAWLEAPPEDGAARFAWVHLFDPHYPYTPPPPYDAAFAQAPGGAGVSYAGAADGSLEYLLRVWGRGGRQRIATTAQDRARLVDLYDGEIAYLDTQLGRLFAWVDAHADATWVVFTADHGESLTEHDYLFDHGQYLYQPTLHVPLMVRGPGLRPGTRDGAAQVIDAHQTLLAAADRAIPREGLGQGSDPQRASIDLLDPVALAARGAQFSEACRPWSAEQQRPRGSWTNLSKAQSVTVWPHKLIVTPYLGQVVLFDLSIDPAEIHDIAASHPDVVKELSERLERWRGGELSVPRPNAENQESLRVLGYVE